MNGVGLINSVLKDTPRFRPSQLWDNQMDDPTDMPPPMARPPGPAGGRPQAGQPGRGVGGVKQARGPPLAGQARGPLTQPGRPMGMDRKGGNPF